MPGSKKRKRANILEVKVTIKAEIENVFKSIKSEIDKSYSMKNYFTAINYHHNKFDIVFENNLLVMNNEFNDIYKNDPLLKKVVDYLNFNENKLNKNLTIELTRRFSSKSSIKTLDLGVNTTPKAVFFNDPGLNPISPRFGISNDDNDDDNIYNCSDI